MIAVWIVIGIIVILILVFVGIYNGLVRLRNQMKNAWAQIDVQLKRRHD
ncbi:MAG: LemA family protein, partial [Dehalococcoidia bacterium]